MRCRFLSSPTKPRRACQPSTASRGARRKTRRKDRPPVSRFAKPTPQRLARQTSRNSLGTAVSTSEEARRLPVASIESVVAGVSSAISKVQPARLPPQLCGFSLQQQLFQFGKPPFEQLQRALDGRRRSHVHPCRFQCLQRKPRSTRAQKIEIRIHAA